MSKISTRYICQACGYSSGKWLGRCPECSAFSTFSEEKVVAPTKKSSFESAARGGANAATWSSKPQSLSSVEAEKTPRLSTGMSELDRVLGGGVVPGSLVLIGGEPGIGKSTLLIEAAVRLAQQYGSGLYVSGEESVSQVGMRATRLGLESDDLLLAAETDLLNIENHIRELRPAIAVVDSIQTAQHPGLESAPGTVTQVREAATTLQRIAKDLSVPIFLVGHVTKEGNLAGPRALEHIVDTVLQLEGDEHTQFRILRALKNRFGSTNELGVFEMTEGGMISVENPSQLFLSQRQESAPGSAVAAVVEGARPLLVEVQALCAPSYFAAPRRVVTGADYNRVLVVLAVIEKRLGLRLGDMDVYINVAGGIKVGEPALDLAIALAVVSSVRDMPLPKTLCAFGEIGLAGEVRAVGHAERRAGEAARLGFLHCCLPRAGVERLTHLEGVTELRSVANLRDAIETWLPDALRGRDSANSSPNERSGSRSRDKKSRSGPQNGSPTPSTQNRSRFSSRSDVQTDTNEEFEPEM
ncbi:MAG TPA: DNA repair protein RadA [Abditibacterium sp.]|jgi:DNA repair protein RadA/Sms